MPLNRLICVRQANCSRRQDRGLLLAISPPKWNCLRASKVPEGDARRRREGRRRDGRRREPRPRMSTQLHAKTLFDAIRRIGRSRILI